jgi:hypothetical protein
MLQPLIPETNHQPPRCRKSPLLKIEMDATPPLKKAKTRTTAALADEVWTPKTPAKKLAPIAEQIPTPKETLRTRGYGGTVHFIPA